MKLIFLLMLLFSVSYLYSQSPAANDPTPGVLANENGRFVFSRLGTEYYMVDTHTGQLWKLSENRDGKYLRPIPYVKKLEMSNANLYQLQPDTTSLK